MSDKRVFVINDPGGGIEFMHIHTDDVCFCLRASMGASKAPIVAIYDARGNGGGDIAPTITGDHENRVTDYTAIVVEKHESIHGTQVRGVYGRGSE